MVHLTKYDAGLRVMFYDKTDRKTVAKYIQDAVDAVDDTLETVNIDTELSEGAEEFLENLPIMAGLSHLWEAGAKLYKAIGRFDYVIGVSSWDEAFNWLANVGMTESKHLKEVQYWGHGSPGQLWIGTRKVSWTMFRDLQDENSDLSKFIGRLREDSLVWFRCCAVFHGAHGQRFAKYCVKHFGCDVAAHTYIIGWWQGGLHILSPGQEPMWDPKEGLTKKNGKPKIKWSRFYSPNTISMMTSHFPEKFRGK